MNSTDKSKTDVLAIEYVRTGENIAKFREFPGPDGREHDLNYRTVTQRTRRIQLFHQLLKGKVGMGKGVESDFAFPEKQIAEMRIAREIGSQYQSIYKKSDKVFEFDVVAARNRNAYQNIVGPGIAVEKRFKHGRASP